MIKFLIILVIIDLLLHVYTLVKLNKISKITKENGKSYKTVVGFIDEIGQAMNSIISLVKSLVDSPKD